MNTWYYTVSTELYLRYIYVNYTTTTTTTNKYDFLIAGEISRAAHIRNYY